MRTFVIISKCEDVNIEENLINRLPDGSDIIVYMKKSLDGSESHKKIESETRKSKVSVRFFQDEFATHWSKLKNFISKELLDEKRGGFVHVIEDGVEIFGEPSRFLDEIEKMMTIFSLKSWFNTSCDQCNMIYSKYNPRMYVAIDEPEAEKTYKKTIAWCSNANTMWVCYNLDICRFEDIRFEENFQYPMYYIIEFLARRRNLKSSGELYYMNYYPSVEDELGVFRGIDIKDNREFSKEEIENEGRIFQDMKVDNHPDQSIDQVIGDMRNAILEYAAKIK